jgi:hypothetical protein
MPEQKSQADRNVTRAVRLMRALTEQVEPTASERQGELTAIDREHATIAAGGRTMVRRRGTRGAAGPRATSRMNPVSHDEGRRAPRSRSGARSARSRWCRASSVNREFEETVEDAPINE